ncbi:MAG: formylglycine-generating enzyme family protein [Candidatus Kapaibacterium sp.]
MDTLHQGGKSFPAFRLSALIPAMLCAAWWCAGCNTTDPEVFYNIRSAAISANMPGGTEGYPDSTYVFTLRHTYVTVPRRYVWTFDDGDSLVTRDSLPVRHRFRGEGSYTVVVRIVNLDVDREVIRTSLTVNIRSRVPVIPLTEVPAGTFIMGNNRNISQSEMPAHTVSVSRAYLVSTYEVRNMEWNMIMPRSPSWSQQDSLPVENITWFEAVDFCNRLSIRSGLVPAYSIKGDTVQCFFSASGYRLPTEAEWEYFARAGTSTEFYSGNPGTYYSACLASDTLEPLVDLIGWYCLNAESRSHAGGGKKPNGFGLHDMIGNVGEWCWDWLDGTYYRNSPSVDPAGPPRGDLRVVRGGDFTVGVLDSRVSARRLSANPSTHTYSIGLRVIRPKSP